MADRENPFRKYSIFGKQKLPHHKKSESEQTASKKINETKKEIVSESVIQQQNENNPVSDLPPELKPLSAAEHPLIFIPPPKPLTLQNIWETPFPLIISMILFFAALELPYRAIHIPKEILVPIGVVSLTIILMLAFENFHLIALILVGYMPFSRILPGDFGNFMMAFNMTNILIAVVVVGMLVKSSLRREHLYERSPLDIPLLLFCGLASISVLRGMLNPTLGHSLGDSVIELKRWLTPYFLYFVFSNNVKNRQEVINLLVIMCITVTIVGLMGIKEFYLDKGYSSSYDKMRIEGITEQPNNLGAFFTFYSFLLLSFAFYFWRKVYAKFLLLGFIICFRAMTFTFSRGAMLSFMSSFFLFLFIVKRRFSVILLGLILALFFSPNILPDSIAGRFKSARLTSDTGPEGMEASARARIIVWKGGIEMIRDNFLFGVGYELFPLKINNYIPKTGKMSQMDAHNGFILLAAEMGMITFVFYIVVLIIPIYYAFWLYKITNDLVYKAMSLGIITAFAGAMISNMFGSRMYAQELTSYLWILTGLLMAVYRAEKARVEEIKDKANDEMKLKRQERLMQRHRA